jgi:AraC-like DNA-binding protein
VTDIALSSGFEDSNYFSTQFRHEYAQSPSEYRLRHRQTN